MRRGTMIDIREMEEAELKEAIQIKAGC